VPGSAQYEAAALVLARLNADIVSLNEVDDHEANDLRIFADLLGYPEVIFPSSNPFGSQRNAMLSRLPVDRVDIWTSSDLADDPAAKLLEKETLYKEQFANPYEAAARGFVDEVIRPSETRNKVIAALDMLRNKVDKLPRKKHGNIPL
jgi:hypothetical protein